MKKGEQGIQEENEKQRGTRKQGNKLKTGTDRTAETWGTVGTRETGAKRGTKGTERKRGTRTNGEQRNKGKRGAK